MNKPKALIIGDYTSSTYHPFQGIDTILTDLLSEYFSVRCTEERDELKIDSLTNYELCISYVDAWEKQLSPDQAQGLMSFVKRGGGFLAVHNGISYQSTPEFAELIGAKFTSHPPYQKLTFNVTDIKHPITDEIKSFEMEEELYLFEMLLPSNSTFLMNCTDGSTVSPALWTKTYGSGRIVYLAPGHDMRTFSNKAFQELAQRCALWAGGMLR